MSSSAIQFLRSRIDNGLPLYQGDVDAALEEARRELAPVAALDVKRLAEVLWHHPFAGPLMRAEAQTVAEQIASLYAAEQAFR